MKSEIKIYEPVTQDILSREEVMKMRLPFHFGWDTWMVTSPTGRILGEHSSYLAAVKHLHSLPHPAIAA